MQINHPRIHLLVLLLGFVLLSVFCSCQSRSSSPQGLENFDFLPSSTTNAVVAHAYYTLSYNEKYEQAEWVAYVLKKEHIGNANLKRPYFIQDEMVKTGSADWRNYKRSGYTRGHLLPAGDRTFNKKAFEETFFTSNISPQKSEFNSGVWNRLDQKTRYWAEKYDELYVVTGGVLTNDLKTIGYEQVAVPKYFYKILLDYTDPEIKAIAFLVPHKVSDDPLYTFVTSIDAIEEMTQIDFFPALPDDLEQQLESTSNYKNWSF